MQHSNNIKVTSEHSDTILSDSTNKLKITVRRPNDQIRVHTPTTVFTINGDGSFTKEPTK